MKFSIVIPLFNEAENILKLNSEIIQVLNDLKNTNNEFEIISRFYNLLFFLYPIFYPF